MIKLFLKETDVAFLTAFSGNIDVDSLKPHIYVAQTNDIKRVLGLKLYNKIYTDFVSDALTGIYKQIFDEYVIDMLVYFTCEKYVQFGSYKTTNAGIYKSTADGGQIVDYKEVANLSSKYRQLGVNVEENFRTFMRENLVAEFSTEERTNIIGWY
jgi:hypothetical protein